MIGDAPAAGGEKMRAGTPNLLRGYGNASICFSVSYMTVEAR